MTFYRTDTTPVIKTEWIDGNRLKFRQMIMTLSSHGGWKLIPKQPRTPSAQHHGLIGSWKSWIVEAPTGPDFNC